MCQCLLLVNGAEKLETWKDLLLWPVSLDNGADNRNIDILGANIMGRRDYCNVDI